MAGLTEFLNQTFVKLIECELWRRGVGGLLAAADGGDIHRVHVSGAEHVPPHRATQVEPGGCHVVHKPFLALATHTHTLIIYSLKGK